MLGGASSERFLHGLRLHAKGGEGVKILFTGGGIGNTAKKIVHTLVRSENKSVIRIQEAGNMYDTALLLNVPEDTMYLDPLATNTYENAMHAGALMKKKGFQTCLLVTSPTHMLRVWLVARKAGLKECYPAPVSDYTPFIKSSAGRLSLMRAVMWEYSALALYSLYGYI